MLRLVTIDRPFASLQYAHDLAQPGDTIYLRGGIYSVSTPIKITKDGAAGAPITVTSYPGEKAILDAAVNNQGMWDASVLQLNNANWNIIKNLELRNGPGGGLGLYGASSNNIIEGLDVHHNGTPGLGWHWYPYDGVWLQQSTPQQRLAPQRSRRQRRRVHLSSTGTGNVARGNRTWANSDDGDSSLEPQ